VLAKGSLTSKTSGEGDIRKNIIEAGLLDCIVNLPAKLFLNTQIPACLWFLSRKKDHRKDNVLFIDARNLGYLVNRKTKDFTDEDIAKIAVTYHKWKDKNNGYQDVPGFCKSVTLGEIRKRTMSLPPDAISAYRKMKTILISQRGLPSLNPNSKNKCLKK
jgi:type I restriction enzyme M protein